MPTYGLVEASRCRSWCSQLRPNFLRGWETGERLWPAPDGTTPSWLSPHVEIQTLQAWKSKGTHYWVGILKIWAGRTIHFLRNPAGTLEIQLGMPASQRCWAAQSWAGGAFCWPESLTEGLNFHKNSSSHFFFHPFLLLSNGNLKNSLKGLLKINRETEVLQIQLETAWNKQHKGSKMQRNLNFNTNNQSLTWDREI